METDIEEQKPEVKKTESRLKGVLVFEIVVIVVLSAWLGFTGGFEDLFRKDGEGVEPTVGRMVKVCASDALLMLGEDGGTVCGKVGMSAIGSDDEDTPREVYKVRMADGSKQEVKEIYEGFERAVYTGRGAISVILEDSDEMFKFVEISGNTGYTMFAYYRGKKFEVIATHLTIAEDTLVDMGLPNRNRSDTGELAERVELAKKEHKNIGKMGLVKYRLQQSMNKGQFPSLYESGTFRDEPEVVSNVDENTNSDIGSKYYSIIADAGPIVDYKGDKIYWTVAVTARPDLAESGVLEGNQMMIHYNAKCVDGTVVATEETGLRDYRLFAITYPKLDGSGYHCMTGNEE